MAAVVLLAGAGWGQGTQTAVPVAPAAQASAQSAVTTPGKVRAPEVVKAPTKDDLLRGGYGPYRANNDLLFYALKLRVDPEAKTISGSNMVRFRMLEDGEKIQLELTPELTIEGVTFQGDGRARAREGMALKYTREERTVWVELPRVLQKGEVGEVEVKYSGKPVTQGRFGCFSFDKDKAGKPWITTACEEEGASVWWPNKDQWRDEPQDGMEIDVAVPNGLMDVSNGRFVGSKDLGDGYTEWQWRVHYPINNYDVALNIGEYQHWDDVHVNKETGEKTTLDYYALPEDLAKAKAQFAQVPEMLDAYEHYFGEYPFDLDGYKLIDVPYAGMEHQSAVAYGNHFENGYYGRDWTGVGISPKFDFIIIHESAHEWFGNAVTAKDRSDMWIHEGWATYMESLYVEYRWGKADGLKYLNGLKPKVHNELPIIAARGTNAEPTQDQYFKGALMLGTLRSVVNDDAKWFADIRDFYQAFQYKTIMTEDVEAWWSKRTGMELKPFFDAYLREATIPMLRMQVVRPVSAVGPTGKEQSFGESGMRCDWVTGAAGFAMPVKVGNPEHWITIEPVRERPLLVPWKGGDFKPDTDLYYVNWMFSVNL